MVESSIAVATRLAPLSDDSIVAEPLKLAAVICESVPMSKYLAAPAGRFATGIEIGAPLVGTSLTVKLTAALPAFWTEKTVVVLNWFFRTVANRTLAAPAEKP